MSIKDASAMLVTWLGLLAAIVGGYAAYSQYRDSVSKQVDDRATAAINFVMQFQNVQMMPVREKVLDFISCRSDCGVKRPSSSQFFAFVEFFDAAKYCADKGLCDSQIITDVFGPYATWHWQCLAADIEAVRKGEAVLKLARPFGHGLETLAVRNVGTEHCGNLKSR